VIVEIFSEERAQNYSPRQVTHLLLNIDQAPARSSGCPALDCNVRSIDHRVRERFNSIVPKYWLYYLTATEVRLAIV